MTTEHVEITAAPTEQPGHQGGCGCAHDSGETVLDVREIPHAIRHGVVFGALSALAPGADLVLVAPHDPLPLLGQLEQREPGAFDIAYLRREPAECHIRLTRRG